MKRLNVLLKLALLALLTHAALYSELPQYQNKAVPLRLVFYPIAAALTFVVWRFVPHALRRQDSYPYSIDLCITFVVTFDLFGNTIGAYDAITWWDDLMHFFLSIPWVLVVGYALRNQPYPPRVIAGLVLAYGSTSHIIWELLEYVSFVRTNPMESPSAYQDTMGDLLLSTLGTIVGAWFTMRFLAVKNRRGTSSSSTAHR